MTAQARAWPATVTRPMYARQVSRPNGTPHVGPMANEVRPSSPTSCAVQARFSGVSASDVVYWVRPLTG